MRRILATLSFAMLSLTPAIGKEPPSDYPVVSMKPGNGLIMLRVINTRDVGGFPKWQTLTLHNGKPAGRDDRLNDRFMYDLQSSVFMASLSPGDYAPVRLSSTLPGYMSTTTAEVDFPRGFRFKVEAGKLTDLGTLYNLRPYFPAETTVFRFVHAGDRDLARDYSFMFSSDQAPALLAEPLGWSDIPAIADPASLMNKTRRLSMALNGGQRAQDGSVLFGELFGQIARRGSDGEWTWEKTGIVETILGAAETADGKLYAVSEHSTLMRRDAPGRWERITVPRVGALPCHVSADPDGSLLTAWQDGRTIAVYSYRPADSSPWKLRVTIPLPEEPWIDSRAYQRCALLMSEPRTMVVTYTFARSGTNFGYHVLDKESSIWTAYRPDEFQGEVGLRPDGSMFALAGWKRGQDFNSRTLPAAKWQKLSELAWATQPSFRDANEGYVLHVDNGQQGWAWPMKREISLWRTSDGGRTWTPRARAPLHTEKFLLLAGQDILFRTWDGKLYVSHDNGATSMLERDSSSPVW